MRPVVEVQALTKRYGARVAVNQVTFEVQPGEVMGLLGPNGSGKSTILRVLTGYLAPSAGTARVAGFDVVSQARAARACVGYVPEDVPLYPHMRVNELLTFTGHMRGLDGDALEKTLDATCGRLRLHPARELLIGKLSRGYRQRVAIAQAVLHRPRLVVLDEPTNGLDPCQIIELRGLIRDLASDSAVLVTSHVLAEIERVADRAAILVDGRLLRVHTLGTQSSGGAAWIRLRVAANDALRARAALSRVPGVAEVESDGMCDGLGQFRARLTDAGVAQRVAAALCRDEVALHEMAHDGSDLEHLFLQLTAPMREPRSAPQ